MKEAGLQGFVCSMRSQAVSHALLLHLQHPVFRCTQGPPSLTTAAGSVPGPTPRSRQSRHFLLLTFLLKSRRWHEEPCLTRQPCTGGASGTGHLGEGKSRSLTPLSPMRGRAAEATPRHCCHHTRLSGLQIT